LTQQVNKFRSFDHGCSQTFQVPAVYLAINQLQTAFPHMLNEFYKGIFAGIAYQAEHAFAAKYLTQ
jgi:hypothetical protein